MKSFQVEDEIVMESDGFCEVRGDEWPYAAESVDKPPHYTQGGIECIDAIQAALTEDEFRGYCKGQAIAYLWRERFKGGAVDVAKAAWYCRRLSK